MSPGWKAACRAGRASAGSRETVHRLPVLPQRDPATHRNRAVSVHIQQTAGERDLQRILREPAKLPITEKGCSTHRPRLESTEGQQPWNYPEKLDTDVQVRGRRGDVSSLQHPGLERWRVGVGRGCPFSPDPRMETTWGAEHSCSAANGTGMRPSDFAAVWTRVHQPGTVQRSGQRVSGPLSCDDHLPYAVWSPRSNAPARPSQTTDER